MTFKTIAQHVKQAATDTRGKVAGGAALLVASAAAHAQTAPTGAEAAFSEVQSAGADMAGYAWPVVASITAALIGIKLFKKFANRAS
ncbi:Phage major coat protein, Gp8 [Vreelandella subterranea]|uniref:Phage major coat protein, Gp8 n=1 Tax=Vreelandella subterranea TaxID=416874 RepID=A0A1H9WPD2_9GAMM|nr:MULTISPECIES: major coat protein [Halomonas]QPL46607.1 phage coat protein [Halomonas sp. A40-4]SES35725.1 Phage major coat protein, Gp8 [Halomonas subterranea]